MHPSNKVPPAPQLAHAPSRPRQRAGAILSTLLLLVLLSALTLQGLPRETLPTTPRYEEPLPDGALARIGKGKMSNMALSPDGQYLAISSSIGMYMYRADTFEPLWFRPARRLWHPAFSPDGKRLAAGEWLFRVGDSELKPHLFIWDVATGEQLRSLPDHLSAALAWSPDGKVLASGEFQGEVLLWDVDTGELIDHAPTPKSMRGLFIEQITWSPVGIVAVGHFPKDSASNLWEVETGQPLYFREQWYIIAWSPDGTRFVSDWDGQFGGDGNPSIWDLATGERLYTLDGHPDPSSPIESWPPDHWLFVQSKLGDTGRSVILWDAETGARLRVFRDLVARPVTLSPDRTTLLTLNSYQNSIQNSIAAWDTETGSPKRRLDWPKVVEAFAWSPDGSLALVQDSKATLWQVSRDGQLYAPRSLVGWFTDVVWSPSGEVLAALGHDGTVTLWDVRANKALHTLKGRRAEFSPDGKTVALGSSLWILYGTQTLWDVRTGKQHNQLDEGLARSLAWSPDGTKIALVREPGTVVVWDPKENEQLLGLEPVDMGGDYVGEALDLAWSPDATMLSAALSNGATPVWDPSTGEQLYVCPGKPICCTYEPPKPSWSPDGSMLVVILFRSVALCDGATGQIVRELKQDANDAAWSPDSKTLALGTDDGAVILWNVATGETRVFQGHTQEIRRVAFSPDGTILASLSKDGTMLLWRIKP